MIDYVAQRNTLNKYLRKKRLYITLPLFILILSSSFPLVAQVFDIDQLEEMRALIEKERDETPALPIEGEPEIEIKESKELIEEKDANFGYTGEEDYITLSKPKFYGDPLKHFGYDYFVDAPTTFAPATDIPIPPDYILGPGDEIKIILFGNKNEQYLLQVTRDGDIFFPGIGPISVAGLAFPDLKETIQQMVANQIIGTKVSVTLGALRSINVFVLGEAYQPGVYTVSSLSTLTNLIFASGGIRTTGSLRHIEVKRGGQVLSSFDFYNVLLKGDTSDDVRLMTGDVVFIPPISKTVGISGEVERPGIYELKEGEAVHELINFAGTLKPKADLDSVEVERINPSGSGFILINVDLNLISPSHLDLNDGDVLNIYPVINTMQRTVLVKGYAHRPGFYQWKEGMRISDLFNSPEDLMPMTDKKYVLVKRENNINGIYQTLQIDLEKLILKGDPGENILLQEKDEIIFFSTPVGREELIEPILDLLERQASSTERRQTIRIMGNTYYPGEYPLTIGMTLDDAFKAAGGLKEFTHTTDIELLRRNLNEKKYEISTIQLLTSETASLNLKLEPGDIINVKQIPSILTTVTVLGEVLFPGSFPLSADETMVDLISRAGGVKDTASLKAAVFQRESLKENELNRLKKLQSEARRNILLSQTSQEIGDETTIDLATLDSILDQDFDESMILGRLVIDLNSILNGTSESILLEDGDLLTIPKAREIVSVIGEVYVPNSHIFKDGLSIQDYIYMSGGPTEYADTDSSYIIKADGSIVTMASSNSRFFRSTRSVTVETGDTIVLPIQLDQFSTLKATTEITQIVYQMALAAAAVNSF